MTDISEYRSAYGALIAASKRHDAQPTEANQQALTAAEERLRAAEKPLAAEVDTAWEANVAAIQAAKTAVAEAVAERAVVEAEVSTSALGRDPVRPILNAEELARVDVAVTAVREARDTVTAAETAFKAGVTPEQIEEV